MLFVLTITPLVLGLTIVLMAITRKLKSHPAMEAVESAAESSEAQLPFRGISRGPKASELDHQKEVLK